MINQWLNYWEDSLPPVDLELHLQEAQDLFRQSVQLCDACVTYSLARWHPDSWAETTAGITKTWAATAQDWLQLTGFATGNTDPAAADAITALQERFEDAEARAAKAATEITTLKRSLTQQRKSLAKQIELAEDYRKATADRDQQINALAKQIEVAEDDHKATAAHDQQIDALEQEIQKLTAMLNQLEKKAE